MADAGLYQVGGKLLADGNKLKGCCCNWWILPACSTCDEATEAWSVGAGGGDEKHFDSATLVSGNGPGQPGYVGGVFLGHGLYPQGVFSYGSYRFRTAMYIHDFAKKSERDYVWGNTAWQGAINRFVQCHCSERCFSDCGFHFEDEPPVSGESKWWPVVDLAGGTECGGFNVCQTEQTVSGFVEINDTDFTSGMTCRIRDYDTGGITPLSFARYGGVYRAAFNIFVGPCTDYVFDIYLPGGKRIDYIDAYWQTVSGGSNADPCSEAEEQAYYDVPRDSGDLNYQNTIRELEGEL